MHRKKSAFKSFLDRACCLGLLVCAVVVSDPGRGLAISIPPTPIDVLQTMDAAGTESERAELREIYAKLDGSLIWTTTPRQLAMVVLLASLESDGIDLELLGALENSGASRARADVVVTRAILRGAHILAAGTTAQKTIPGWFLETPAIPVVEIIVSAVRNNRLGSLYDDLRPTADSYRRLRAVNMRYMRLTSEAWPQLDASAEVRLDTSDTRISEITRRLNFLGDLPEADTSSNAALHRAIRTFQTRHGLVVDGRIGPATLAALNVPPAARAQQIAANLEYWRRLPRIWPKRYIAVNTAAARLDLMENGHPIYTSRVIVGDPKHPTPVMAASITAVTFNPSWTVPYSIAVKEILPRLRRDPTYLARSGIKILHRDADPHGLQLDWKSYSQARFPFQLRQVPGPHNALGVVKFEMPNKFDVYLHDTPDKSLFERSARALSHGCVRVECAHALADRLFENSSVWLESGLASALNDNRTITVPLAEPLPVYLLYFTAYVNEDGSVNFRPDIYGREGAVRGSSQQLISRNLAPNVAFKP